MNEINDDALRVSWANEADRIALSRIYNYPLSLERLASVKIALLLWYGAEVQNMLKAMYNKKPEEEAEYKLNVCSDREICVQACSKNLKSLNIPLAIKKQVYHLIRGIANETCRWLFRQDEQIFKFWGCDVDAVQYVDQIAWTCRATIDYVETAKALYRLNDANLESVKPLIVDQYSLDTSYEGSRRSMAYQDYRYSEWQQIIRIVATPRLTNLVRLQTVFIADDVVLMENENHKLTYLEALHNFGHNAQHSWFRSLMSLYEILKVLPFDMVYLLVKELSAPEVVSLFQKIKSVRTIMKTLDSALWEDCFPIFAQYVSQYSSETVFKELINMLVHTISFDRTVKRDNCFSEIDYDRSKFMLSTLWTHAPERFKDYTVAYNDYDLLWTVLSSLCWENHMDAIKLIVSDVAADVKKSMIMTGRGLKLCQRVCLLHNIGHVDSLLMYMLPFDDVDAFRKKLGDIYRDDFSAYIFYRKNADEFGTFLRWYFRSETERTEYKEKLLQTIFPLVLQLCVYGDDSIMQYGKQLVEKRIVLAYHATLQQSPDFSSATYLLRWYFQNDDAKIRQFKRSRIFGEDSYVRDMLREREGNLNFIEVELVKWYCSDDENLSSLRHECRKKYVC